MPIFVTHISSMGAMAMRPSPGKNTPRNFSFPFDMDEDPTATTVEQLKDHAKVNILVFECRCQHGSLHATADMNIIVIQEAQRLLKLCSGLLHQHQLMIHSLGLQVAHNVAASYQPG